MMKRKWLMAAAIAGPLVLLLLVGWKIRQGAGAPGGDAAASAAGRLGEREVETEVRRRARMHEANMQLAKQWHERLTAERPELQIQYIEIPDERNGLVQLLKLLEEAHLLDDSDRANPEIFPQADAMWNMMHGDKPWDPALAAEALKGKEDLLKRLEEIGLMPEQSCRGVDFQRMLGNFNVGALENLMIAKSRLAREAGDDEQARRTLQALEGVAEHVSGTEAPTTGCGIIAENLRRLMRAEYTRAAETATTPEEAEQWRTQLAGMKTPDMAAMLRADWNSLGPGQMLPSLLGEDTYGPPRAADPQAQVAAAAWADIFAQQVRDVSEIGTNIGALRVDLKGSAEVQRMVAGLDDAGSRQVIGDTADFAQGFMRLQVIGRSRADLLAASLAVAAGDDPGVEPLSGQPYRVDREAGTMAMPEIEEFRKIKPRVIPELHQGVGAVTPGQ